MIKVKIRQPRCYGCEHLVAHKSAVPKRVKGVLMKEGFRYCTGGKRTKRFAAHDPKELVPVWCPRRNAPPVLRIYRLKDEQSRYMHYMFKSAESSYSPTEHRYALLYEGKSEFNAIEFQRKAQEDIIFELDGQRLEIDDVIEIDDGLCPYWFYKQEGAMHCIYFNPKFVVLHGM